jgi:hypothetical protein
MTSIEWLEKELLKNGYVNKGYHSQDSLNHLENLFIQSKEMHEKELFEYWNGGINSTEEGGKSFEQYYQETFVSKGSDVTKEESKQETLEEAANIDFSLFKKGFFKWEEEQQLPQQEISDSAKDTADYIDRHIIESMKELAKEGFKPKLSEISDEEIEKAAREWYEKEGPYKPSAIALKTWGYAIRWYREQLKNK